MYVEYPPGKSVMFHIQHLFPGLNVRGRQIRQNAMAILTNPTGLRWRSRQRNHMALQMTRSQNVSWLAHFYN